MLLIVERMRGSAQGDDGPAGLGIVDDLFHLLVGQFQPACEQDYQICVAQRFQARDVVDGVGVDPARLPVDGKKYRAVETVAFGQDLRECGDRFFGAIFLIAGDQDHVLPAAGSVPAGIDQRTLLRPCRGGKQEWERALEHGGHAVHDTDSGRRLSHPAPNLVFQGSSLFVVSLLSIDLLECGRSR